MLMGYNLLPWRRCEERKKRYQFFFILAIILILAAVCGGARYSIHWLNWHQQDQEDQHLHEVLRTTQVQFSTLKQNEKSLEQLNGKIHVLEDYQRRRGMDVALFQALPALVPDGLYMTAWRREGAQVYFEGQTNSTDAVSTFMNRMQNLSLLKGPVLEQIQVGKAAAGYQQFSIQATLLDRVLEKNDAFF